MKTWILLLSFVVFGCATNRPPVKFVPAVSSLSLIDFTPYSSKSFLITPFPYNADYEAVGIFQVVLTPQAIMDSTKSTVRTEAGSHSVVKREWKTDAIDSKKAFDLIYAEASRMGANAIVDLKISEVRNEIVNDPISGYPSTVVYGIRLNGFAIKRLGQFTNTSTTVGESIPRGVGPPSESWRREPSR